MADIHRPLLPSGPNGPNESNSETRVTSVKGFWALRARIARLVFVIAALFQMILMTILQGLIIGNGGDGQALPKYRKCLPDALQMAINCSAQANWTNVTIPSFGKDKAVYVGFIIALTVYNAMLCFYALFWKHFWEIIAFLFLNFLTIAYAGVEVYEFRPFSTKCEVPVARHLAIGSVVVLSIFTILFGILVMLMYPDIKKKVKEDVNNSNKKKLIKYYQWYEVISSGVKVVILISTVYFVAWMSLLLTPDNYEFGLTIILVVVVVVAYFAVQLTIRYNSFTGYVVIACAGILLVLYYAFKIWRFFKHNCPVCQDLTVNLENDHNALVWLLETCTNKSNLTLGDEFNRSLQFKHLSIFAIVNLATTLLVIAIYLPFCCFQPGKLLENHFDTNTNKSMIVRIMCCRLGNGSLPENLKKVKISNVNRAVSDCCVHIKTVIAEAFAETLALAAMPEYMPASITTLELSGDVTVISKAAEMPLSQLVTRMSAGRVVKQF
ncbi:hypothetical protein EMCRGX_G027257 [Ephydatia muelleri]